MSNLPEDLDGLLWTIAEKRDLSAAEDYLQRFPTHRVELMKRLSALESLQKFAPEDVTVPPFTPRPISAPLPTTWIVASILGIGLVGVGVTLFNNAGNTKTETVPVASSASPAHQPSTAIPQLRASRTAAEGVSQSKQATVPLETPPPAPVKTPAQRAIVQKLKLDGVQLSLVLQILAENTGLKLDVQPGLIDPKVSVEYVNQPALFVFEDLGRKFGFQAFEDAPGVITILPKKEETSGVPPQPNESPFGFNPPQERNPSSPFSGPIGKR